MKPKNIFILNGHPGESSLSRLLAETYVRTAETTGHNIRLSHISEMNFDPDFGQSEYRDAKPLEPDLQQVIDNLKWSNHLVLTMPMWWGGAPAKLKGLFDRAFLPGNVFDPRSPTRMGLPSPLMTGRSGRVIITANTPKIGLRLGYRNAILHQMRGQILGLIGIKPVKFSYFAAVEHASEAKIQNWQDKVAKLGETGR